MTIEKKVTDDQIIISLDGWLDAKSAPDLNAQLEQIDSYEKQLVLDLKKLVYISSAGVRQIVYGYKKMNGNFLLMNVQESIMDILSAIGLDKKIPIK